MPDPVWLACCMIALLALIVIFFSVLDAALLPPDDLTSPQRVQAGCAGAAALTGALLLVRYLYSLSGQVGA